MLSEIRQYELPSLRRNHRLHQVKIRVPRHRLPREQPRFVLVGMRDCQLGPACGSCRNTDRQFKSYSQSLLRSNHNNDFFKMFNTFPICASLCHVCANFREVSKREFAWWIRESWPTISLAHPTPRHHSRLSSGDSRPVGRRFWGALRNLHGHSRRTARERGFRRRWKPAVPCGRQDRLQEDRFAFAGQSCDRACRMPAVRSIPDPCHLPGVSHPGTHHAPWPTPGKRSSGTG